MRTRANVALSLPVVQRNAPAQRFRRHVAFLYAAAKNKAARFAYPCKFIRLCMQKTALFVA